MERFTPLTFGPFRLDTEEKKLWRDEREVVLRQTPAEVLQMLVENAPELVTKGQIIRQIWPGKYVTSVVLRVCVSEIRQALGDDARKPQFVETVGRKGYRYIGETEGLAFSSRLKMLGERFEYIVGRQEEVALLEEWFGRAQRGFRQVVFVTGEPGIGKTTLVELLLARIRSERRARIARGQCLEQYGEGEPYLPILEAFGRLCREVGGERGITILNRCAPTWLIQMPSLLRSAEITDLQERIQGANQQRMLREMADALEALSSDSPFVLVLEDLHWSDYSTIELLSYLAQRQDRIRLMIIGTYRPADLTTGHPLKKVKREIQARRQCEELPLALLSRDEVATYVAKRFPENSVSPELINLVYRRTEGNALFLMNVVNTIRGQMIERDGHWEFPANVEDLRIAESLRQVIEEKLDHFSADDRQILEAASVEGREFSAAAIAAAADRDPIDIEDRCADLVRQSQFIREAETRIWSDGSVSARYEFVHALYHEVLYGRLTPGKRVQSHQRIGERLERGYGNRAGEFAAELALHFERGRDFFRAVQYLQQAADQATQRFAYQESIDHLTKTLELLANFPDNAERKQLEIKSQISLGVALMTTKGYAALETKQAYDRARELCQQIGQTSQLAPVLLGLATYYYVRAELATARELGEQLVSLVQGQDDESLLLEAHLTLGGTLSSMGEFPTALPHLQQGIDLYDPQRHSRHAVLYGQDPGVLCLCRASHVLWFLGYPDQALTRSEEALTLAKRCGHPYSLAYALSFAAILHQLRREPRATQTYAEEAIALSTEQGFPTWRFASLIYRGWALACQGSVKEGLASLHEGIEAWRTAGSELARPQFLVLLADVYALGGQIEKGLAAINEGVSLSSATGDRWAEAELLRLKGDLLLGVRIYNQRAKGKDQENAVELQQAEVPTMLFVKEAEECFLRAFDTARRQQAKSMELRIAIDLSRLRHQQGRSADASQLLAGILSWFREGFGTRDLVAAKKLLEELHGGV